MAYLGRLKDEQTALSKNIAELVIYSEGAVSWSEAWHIPPLDSDPVEFDWMPSDLMWQNNIRNCRSQPQCNAADLFQRT